jgi:hypothetical protein
MLVDGFHYDFYDPSVVIYLLVNGDYPSGLYTFIGDGLGILVDDIEMTFN